MDASPCRCDLVVMRQCWYGAALCTEYKTEVQQGMCGLDTMTASRHHAAAAEGAPLGT